MKRVAAAVLLITFLLLLSAASSLAVERLFVGGIEVELEEPLEIVSGVILVPTWLLEKHFGGTVQISDSRITAAFADQTILMRLGEKSALVDGESHKLDVAPQRRGNEVLLPLRFFADRLGFQLVLEEDGKVLRLQKPSQVRERAPLFERLRQETSWAEEPEPVEPVEETAQGLSDIVYMGGARSRVFIDLQSYTGYQTNLLTDPPRLILDLYGVEGGPLPVVEVDDSLLIRIRSSRFDEETIRLVFDLNAASGYKVTPWADRGLEVEFNHMLYAAGLRERDGFIELWLEASHPPSIEAIYLEDPQRLVLDLQDTTLLASVRELPAGYERISRLRMQQHSPEVTRLVLELAGPVTMLPLQEAGPGRYVIPLFQGTAQEAQRMFDLDDFEPVISPDFSDDTKPVFGPQRGEDGEGILRGVIVAIDPGHGGSDPGTIGYHGSFEKDINLAISFFLGKLLKEAGAEVVYTRDTDVYVSIFERPEIAVRAGADLFISIHANSHIKRGTARGTETLYRANDLVSQRLAQLVQAELVQAITLVDRRIWGRDDLAIFNGSTIPAVLVEVGFLDHPDEEVLLRAEGFQQIAAEGIYNGIERFILEYFGKGEGQ